MLERSAEYRGFHHERTDETRINRRKHGQRDNHGHHGGHTCGISQVIAALGVFRARLGIRVAVIMLGIVTVRMVGVLVICRERHTLMAEQIVKTAGLKRRSQRKQKRGYQVKHYHARDYTFFERDRRTKNAAARKDR
jgi:hypothetical protein